MKPKRRVQLGIGSLLILCLVLSAIAFRVSIVTTTVRMLYIITFVTAVAFTGILYRRLYARYPRTVFLLLLPAVLLVWVGFAGRPVDVQGLRKTYVKRLHLFQGTKYVWGGENSFGIDCSGLARTALWQAMIEEGIKERNPRLLGPTLWKFWWNDLSALAMRNEVHGYTKFVGEATRLAGYDTSKLKPGDLAVMNTGIHVLIFVGDEKWIEASPEDLKVVINKAPEDSKRGWFRTGPVRFMRWRMLDQ